MIFAWYFSKFLAQYSWMVCPVNDFELFPSTLTCDQDGSIHPIFQQGTIKPPLLQDYYELIPWEQIYPIQIHALWLGFFASVVGPFGGFLASAIKRAYGIKDFDSIIPGHGGITDRLDCQFLMALCTWVHYNSFVINKLTSMSVSKLIYHYNLMTLSEKKQFLEAILPTTTTTGAATTGGDE
jgi:phosphatidate cytidylyltransferase